MKCVSILSAVMLIFSCYQISVCQIEIRHLKSKEDPAHCDITIQYPYCSDPRAKTLNDKVLQFVRSQRRDFLRDAKSYYTDMDSDLIATREFPYVSVQVKSAKIFGSLVSYCLEYAMCPSWGCHGTTEYTTYNFDLSHQRFLSPSDFILTPEYEVCKVVYGYVDSLLSDAWDDSILTPDSCKLNKLKVNIEEKDLVFNFSAYELGPGWHQVAIPRTKFSLKIPK
ncbi:MAG TPA: hypothetical protein VLY03_03520 [Bacteroidota bacterium]|nr:hypothetical protein [Bacteroidota bacterium]